MTLPEGFSRIRNAASELGVRARTAVVTVKDTLAEREVRKRTAAQYGLTRIATALSKTVDGLQQGEFHDYSLSFLNPASHEGLALELKGTGLSLGFQGDEVCVDHRQKVNGIPTRAVLSFTMYQERNHIVNMATAKFKNGASVTEYTLVLDPREPGFGEDGVVRQLARQTLDYSNLIYGAVTEMARKQLRENEFQETGIDSVNDRDDHYQPLTLEQQYLLQNSFPHFAPHIPPIEPYKVPFVEEGRQLMRLNDAEKSQEIISQIEACSQEITHLRVIKPEDLPYHDVDPQLAAYVAGNSIAVHTDTHPHPIGIISAQPETGTLLFQALTDSGDFLPTVVFNNPNFSPSHRIETLQLGFTPYANPYDITRTTLYSITPDGIKASTLLAQTLLKRLAVDIQKDIDFDIPLNAINGMPYIGMDPQSFFAYAQETIQVAVPDKEATKLTTEFYDHEVHGSRVMKTAEIPDFAIALNHGGGSTESILIWSEAKKGTKRVVFENFRGKHQTSQTTVSFDNDGIYITDGKSYNTARITPQLLKENPEWRDSLKQMRRQLRNLEDGWSLVKDAHSFSINERAQLEIESLLEEMWEFTNREGEVPFMALSFWDLVKRNGQEPTVIPRNGGVPNTLLVKEPLPVGPDVWLPISTNSKIRIPLLTPEDTDTYPEYSFLGSLAAQARREKLAEEDTGEHFVIKRSGHFDASSLVDPHSLAKSKLMQAKQTQQASTNSILTIAEPKGQSELPSSASPSQAEPEHLTDTDSVASPPPSDKDLADFARVFLQTDTSDEQEDAAKEAKAPKEMAKETTTPRQRTRRSIADGTKKQKEKIKAGISKKVTSNQTRPSARTTGKSSTNHRGSTSTPKRKSTSSAKARS